MTRLCEATRDFTIKMVVCWVVTATLVAGAPTPIPKAPIKVVAVPKPSTFPRPPVMGPPNPEPFMSYAPGPRPLPMNIPFLPVPAPKPVASKAFIKTVLKEFFAELKRHPSLVKTILKQASVGPILPADEVVELDFIDPSPRWIEMPPFKLVQTPKQQLPQQQIQQQQQQQQQQTQIIEPAQEVVAKRQGPGSNQEDATPILAEQPAPKVKQVQLVQAGDNEARNSGVISPEGQGHPLGGTGSLQPSGPNSYFYVQNGVPVTLPGSQANGNGNVQDGDEFYEADSPAYYYYFYYDENENPNEETATQAQSGNAPANENEKPVTDQSKDDAEINGVAGNENQSETKIIATAPDNNEGKTEDKAEADLTQFQSE